MAPVLFLHPGDGGVAPAFRAAVAKGDLRWIRQTDVTSADLIGLKGLILPHAIDQIALMEMKEDLEAFLDRGGRLMLQCHVLRPFIEGLGIYEPMLSPKRPDFDLIRRKEHPVFAGVEVKVFEANKGVVGFYGRGHNPMPLGAEALQVFGARQIPVDWEWARPRGGHVFSHAGNNLWVVGDLPELRLEMGQRLVNWCKGEA